MDSLRVAEVVGRTLAGLGVDHAFGVVGSGNFHVTNALVAGGARFVATRHEGGVLFPDTDIAAIGRGFGCAGLVVRKQEDLAGLAGWLEGPRDAPIVVDAKVTSRRGAWWLEEAFRGH